MKCQQCKKRKAAVKFVSEPTFATTHGFGITHLCRQCYIDIIEEELKTIKRNLITQRKLLRMKR